MAQFELTLISANARYDRVMAGQDTFTEQEKGGYILFKKNCARCHTEPFFTNRSFARNNLPMDTFLQDAGRMRITKDPADSLFFKVPSLRNLEFSYPYMDDGRFRHLSDVLNYYDQSKNLGIRLNAHDKVDLMAFLLTLTDKEFLFNPDFAFPRN